MTSFTRSALVDFDFGIALYAGATVTAYTVDTFGNKTAFLATLYEDLTSTSTLSNPQTLDGFGKWAQPIYIDAPVILTVTGANGVPDHQTGVISANLAGSAATDAATSASQAAGFFGAASDVVGRAKAFYAKLVKLGFPVSLVGKALSFVRVNAFESGYEFRTPAQTLGDIGVTAAMQAVVKAATLALGRAAFGFGTSLTEPLTKEPTRTVLTSGSGTYTTPTGATRLALRMFGAGGGAGGNGTSAGAGTNAGNSIFSTATALGGVGSGANASGGGAGGATSGGTNGFAGGNGSASSTAGSANTPGGNGGQTPLGGRGAGGAPGAGGGNAVDSTGSGGGGAGAISTFNATGGGGAGAYIEFIIIAPVATYSYSVGAKGTGGAAGTGGLVGGNGAAGIILIDEFYN